MMIKKGMRGHLPKSEGTANAQVPFDSDALEKMEGRKQRLKTGGLSFTPSKHNLDLIKKYHPTLTIWHHKPNLRLMPGRADRAIGVFKTSEKTPLYNSQREAFELAQTKDAFGIFHDPGLGKTRTALDIACNYYAQGKITGVLVVTFKGVHRQWVNQQIPEHIGTINGKPIAYEAIAIDGNTPPSFRRGWTAVLEILAVNFESLQSNFKSSHINQFCSYHQGTLMVIIDESHAIKTFDSSRTINCIALSEVARFRLILTGTPTAKSIQDEYVQSLFLDKEIFGYEYLKSFQVAYQNKDGSPKNLEKFQALLAPYVHRMRKEDAVDLPEKIYERYEFELNPQTRKAYSELKRNFFTTLNGEDFTVQNGAVLMMRLQQICCGLIVNEDKSTQTIGDERLIALKELLPKYEEQKKIIVWSRFRHDIEPVKAVLEKFGDVVTLNGVMKEHERRDAARGFMENPKVKFGLFNATVAGTGFNFQGECTTNFYYSNSFNSVERWQSEDRIHRIGTKYPCNYVDFIARNTVDEYILKSLRDKKDLSDLISGYFLNNENGIRQYDEFE